MNIPDEPTLQDLEEYRTMIQAELDEKAWLDLEIYAEIVSRTAYIDSLYDSLAYDEWVDELRDRGLVPPDSDMSLPRIINWVCSREEWMRHRRALHPRPDPPDIHGIIAKMLRAKWKNARPVVGRCQTPRELEVMTERAWMKLAETLQDQHRGKANE